MTNNIDKIRVVADLFDRLKGEVYFGYNVKCMLTDQTPEFLNQLDTFLKDCENYRKTHDPEPEIIDDSDKICDCGDPDCSRPFNHVLEP